MSTPPIRAELRLTLPPGALWDSYAVYYRRAGAVPWLPLASSSSERIMLETLPRDGRYEIAVAPRRRGIEAEPDRWTVVPWDPRSSLRDLDTPTAVQSVRAGQDGNSVRIDWEPVDVANLSHYEVRMGSAWVDAVRVALVRAPATSVTVGVWWTGSTTYRVRAVTQQGLISAADGLATINIESQQYEPIQATVDESGGGFAATKATTEVSGGSLRITALPATAGGWTDASSTYTQATYLPHRGSGTYTTAWVDVGSVVRERVEVQLVATQDTTALTSAEATWPGIEDGLDPGERGIGDRLDSDGYDLDGLGITVEIDTAQDATPTSDGWRRWVPGTVYLYRQVQLRITLATVSPRSPLVATLKWRRRRQNRKDETALTISGTGGTTWTFSTTFTAAPLVTATPLVAGDQRATISDVTSASCKVRLYDAAGTEQASGTVHVHALGV